MAQRRMIGDENPDVYDHAPVEPSLLSAADARLLRPEVFVAEQLPGDGAVVGRRKDGKLQCQRRGCGQLYVEGDGAACFVHPGEPLSVGNVKAWSCCGAHDASFAQLAALKGCVRGQHTQEGSPAGGEGAEDGAVELQGNARPPERFLRSRDTL